jgi:hypothetical protein
MDMKFHPLCEKLPALTASEYQMLVDDIKAKGLQRPITIYEDQVLDGRHRYLACKDAGVDPRFDEYTGSDPIGFVASSCVHRSLTSGQRAFIAAGFLEYEAAQARERQSAAGGDKRALMERVPQAIKGLGSSRDIAGSRMNVSGRSVDDAAKIIESGSPELVEKLRTGEIALREAKTISAFNPKAQANIVNLPKRERAAAIESANTRSVGAMQRHAPRVVHDMPGTPFLRTLLSATERLAMVMSESGIRSVGDIVKTFNQDMDWNSMPLVTQFERGEPVMRAFAEIAAARKSKAA